jgi:hypothetical protein
MSVPSEPRRGRPTTAALLASRPASPRSRQPCPLRFLGFDCDNGGEFLNWHLVDYFNRPRSVPFTRSRPCHKDDNARVEHGPVISCLQTGCFGLAPAPELLPLRNSGCSNLVLPGVCEQAFPSPSVLSVMRYCIRSLSSLRCLFCLRRHVAQWQRVGAVPLGRLIRSAVWGNGAGILRTS